MMASASDRDKDINDQQPKSENPFIKFRQFADSQISSLLQGIVGLPSAFTKNPNNARWAEFDDDMRRRDELQKRQNELRDLEAMKQGEGRDWASLEKSNSNKVHDEEMDEKIAKEIPLYSPVSKSLFTHLSDAKDDTGGDWKPLLGGTDLWFTPGLYDPFGTYRSHSDAMRALRTTIYRDLRLNPILRSQYSLLPYLLFSPYSPLKLEFEDEYSQNQDSFPWGQAFQDLILASQGRPSIPLLHNLLIFEQPRGWIYRLWAHGALQQRGTTNNPALADFSAIIRGQPPMPWSEKVSSPPRYTQLEEDAQTEQEMYERFLRRASSSTGIAEVLESLFTDAEGWINKQLMSLDPAEMKRQLKEFTDLLEQKTGNEAEDEKRTKAAKALESLFNQAEGLLESRRTDPSDGKRKVETFAETKIGKELEEMKRKVAADPDKAVFTSTMTEHTTNEDGSVETSVTVWKRYADGRETTTTRSHTEGPGSSDSGDGGNEREGLTHAEKVETNEANTSEKKGWFWN